MQPITIIAVLKKISTNVKGDLFLRLRGGFLANIHCQRVLANIDRQRISYGEFPPQNVCPSKKSLAILLSKVVSDGLCHRVFDSQTASKLSEIYNNYTQIELLQIFLVNIVIAININYNIHIINFKLSIRIAIKIQ